MSSHKSKLLSSTFMPLVLGATIAAGAALATTQAAAKQGDGFANPTAVSKASSGAIRLAACKACNPCAAKKGCNPCAAKGCNPCAAKKACGACNPCAAKKACGACNPCAAKKKK